MRAQDRSKWRQLVETAMLTDGRARYSMMMMKKKKKMVLFHIAAIGWISPQTGYEISTQN